MSQSQIMSFHFILAAGLSSENKGDREDAEETLADILRVNPNFRALQDDSYRFELPWMHYEQRDRILHQMNQVPYSDDEVPDFNTVNLPNAFRPVYGLSFVGNDNKTSRQMVSFFRCIDGDLRAVTYVIRNRPYEIHVTLDELLRDHPFEMSNICVRELGYKAAMELMEKKKHTGVLTVEGLKKMWRGLRAHTVHPGGCGQNKRCILCKRLNIPPGENVITCIRKKISDTYTLPIHTLGAQAGPRKNILLD